MSTISEIGGDKQSVEASLYAFHNRLRCYINDQLVILDDIMSTIESFYKTEKHTQERMKLSLQKSLEHTQGLSCLGPSIIGTSWTTALKELTEHYAQREASCPVLKQVVLENLKKIRNEKIDEQIKISLYEEEIVKEMVEIERRTLKTKRLYDEAFERYRQRDSGIKQLRQKILPKYEIEKIENALIESRNMYILQVNQMNYALKFYIEQFIVDLDKLLASDLFPQVKQALDDLVYSEYKRLHDILQRAIQIAVADGDEQKRRLLPKTYQNYPLFLPLDQSDQINLDDRYIPLLASTYLAAINEVRETDQQIQLALETSVLNAQLNKDSRMDAGKIKLKRMEMRKSMALFVIDMLEKLVPNIKTAPTTVRPTKSMGGLKPFATTPTTKSEYNSNNPPTSSTNGIIPSTSPVENDSSSIYPCQAVVLYDFEAANEDELSVKKDDKIFIESKPEYDGWLVAKGRGRSGLVPESYVQLIPPIISPPESNVTKKSNMERTRKKSMRENKKSISDTTPFSSSPTTVFNDADYFTDD